jgi:hypothetical protein
MQAMHQSAACESGNLLAMVRPDQMQREIEPSDYF